MANTDPFSSSVVPFEVPEQMRAFAEKGVSQARDNYAKFKDAAETHNGTIEAVLTNASKGAVGDADGPGQGARRARQEGRHRDRRADQGLGLEALPAGRLIVPARS